MSKYEILQQDKVATELMKRKQIRSERYRAKYQEKVLQ